MKWILSSLVIFVCVVLTYFYFDNKDIVIAIEAEVTGLNVPESLASKVSKGAKVSGRLHIPYLLWKSNLSGQMKGMKKYILPGGEASFLFKFGNLTVVSNEQSESLIEILNDTGVNKEDYFLIRFMGGALEGGSSESVTLALQLHDVDGDALVSEVMPTNFNFAKWSGGNNLNLRIERKRGADQENLSKGPRRKREKSISIQSKVTNVTILRQ